MTRGANVFNQWRSEHSSRKYLDLSYLHIRGLDLRDVRLEGLKMRGTTFEEVDLRGSRFAGTNLNASRFVACHLDGVDFRQARLAQADLRGQALDGCDLFETIRDGWSIGGVQCGSCWITQPRDSDAPPDVFAPGEFELCYGGRRFKVRFPGGVQPIDLVALPFHAARFAEHYPTLRLVLVGLSTLGEPALEFRVDDELPDLAEAQSAFDEAVAAVRQTLLDPQGLRQFTDDLLKRHIGSAAPGGTGITVIVAGDLRMGGDSFHNAGQAGAIGPQATAIGVEQTWNDLRQDIDLPVLATELRALLAEMQKRDDAPSGELQAVAAAADAAEEADGPASIGHLRRATRWTLGVARDIGVEVAAQAIGVRLP